MYNATCCVAADAAHLQCGCCCGHHALGRRAPHFLCTCIQHCHYCVCVWNCWLTMAPGADMHKLGPKSIECAAAVVGCDDMRRAMVTRSGPLWCRAAARVVCLPLAAAPLVWFLPAPLRARGWVRCWCSPQRACRMLGGLAAATNLRCCRRLHTRGWYVHVDHIDCAA